MKRLVFCDLSSNAATDLGKDFGAVAKGAPVAGLIRVVDSPDFDSTDLPLIKLLSFFMGRA